MTSADATRREQEDSGPGVPRPRPQRVQPLIPDGARRPAAITAACCLLLVAVLAVLAAHKSSGNAVDRPIDSWLVGHLAAHDGAMFDITRLGDRPEVTAFTAVIVLACLAARRVNGAVLAVISVVVAVGLTEYVLKPLVHETLGSSLTYPSGHMSVVVALIGVVGVLMLAPQRPQPRVRRLIMLGLVLVGCIVAVALIAIQFHYFTDTIAGAAVGVGVVLATAFLLDMSWIRRVLGAAWPSRSPA